MGGINHAPCNRYLRNSTKVSMFLTLAHAELQLANVAFEQALLRDLDGKPSSPKKIMRKLEQSKNTLISFGQSISRLKQQMDRNHFADLPTLRTMDLSLMGQEFSSHGIVNLDSWHRVQRLMESGGFHKVITHFTERARTLIELTDGLYKGFSGISLVFESGHLNLLLEQNEEGNVKVAFAKLFREWSDFLNDFLASSMLSTELWYTHSNFGSMFAPADEKSMSATISVAPHILSQRAPHFMVHEKSF